MAMLTYLVSGEAGGFAHGAVFLCREVWFFIHVREIEHVITLFMIVVLRMVPHSDERSQYARQEQSLHASSHVGEIGLEQTAPGFFVILGVKQRGTVPG